MNNARDAPPQPETFPKEQERAPVAGSIPPGRGGRCCRRRHRAPSPPQNQTPPPLHALGLTVVSARESASSSSQPGGGRSPGTRLSPQSQTVAPRERRQFCRAQGTCHPSTGSTAKGSAAEEEPNTGPNPTAPLGSREEPGAHRGIPHATHIARACRVPCVPTRSRRGGLPVPHACPAAVLAACLHTHVPRRRVAASNVNARAGLLRLQVHESLSSGGGNLPPRRDHLRAAAGPVRAGAAPAPPPRRGYLGRPKGGAAAASSCAAAGGTQEPAAVSGPNPLASSRTRRAPWLAPHGQGKPPHSRDTAQGSPCPTTAAWGCATAGCREGREILATGVLLRPP